MAVTWLAVLTNSKGLKIPNGFISLSGDVDCVKGKRATTSSARGSVPNGDSDGGINVKLERPLLGMNILVAGRKGSNPFAGPAPIGVTDALIIAKGFGANPTTKFRMKSWLDTPP